jgi:tetratricopeptide (TPR) repeat protein
MTGKQQLTIWLAMVQVYLKTDIEAAKSIIDRALTMDMPLDLRIAYVDRLAVYHNLKKDTDRAIKILEDFIQKQPAENDTRVMIRLAALHNDLGVFYSDQKNIEEAHEHLNIALSLWKRYNIRRYLGLIYNNLSDLYLKQGITIESLKYSKMGFAHSDELNLTMMKALALLNRAKQ